MVRKKKKKCKKRKWMERILEWKKEEKRKGKKEKKTRTVWFRQFHRQSSAFEPIQFFKRTRMYAHSHTYTYTHSLHHCCVYSLIEISRFCPRKWSLRTPSYAQHSLTYAQEVSHIRDFCKLSLLLIRQCNTLIKLTLSLTPEQSRTWDVCGVSVKSVFLETVNWCGEQFSWGNVYACLYAPSPFSLSVSLPHCISPSHLLFLSLPFSTFLSLHLSLSLPFSTFLSLSLSLPFSLFSFSSFLSLLFLFLSVPFPSFFSPLPGSVWFSFQATQCRTGEGEVRQSAHSRINRTSYVTLD